MKQLSNAELSRVAGGEGGEVFELPDPTEFTIGATVLPDGTIIVWCGEGGGSGNL